MNPRSRAMEIVGSRYRPSQDAGEGSAASQFGDYVFGRHVMQQILPPEIYQNVINAMEGREKIRPEFADTIAVAMKEWALERGATHYSHWFQPLTGASAEKHDAFIDWQAPGQAIEKFTGKQLLQGEPDASSFPSGGLRTTFEARGYTGWDPSSPVFIWKAGDGMTLCIPSVFFSWTGDVLDTKIPLLRSDKKINDAVLRVLRFTGIDAGSVFSTLGLEQEYFVIDRALRDLRPDLVLCGRTVFGAPPAKGQELQDHYFGSVKDRILSYMADFEARAWQLGIPLKTRHNEVAPAQHEVAPVFEKASIAIDHNILLMELMRQTARQHGLACLLHEKPFHDLNGSGKHANWSLLTDTGINLLDPSDTPENNLHFLVLLTAVLHAVHRHSALLRASIGSAANDLRLGGHEAPPAIISIYLGDTLEQLLDNIEKSGSHKSSGKKGSYDLGLAVIPELPKDYTDRNRTSPFAFTGNKFEFRAVGASSNPAFPTTVLNAIVAESVNEIMDAIEAERAKSPSEAVVAGIRSFIKASRHVLFMGDNYSDAWVKEAEKRGLPNIHKSTEAFQAMVSESTAVAFEGILTRPELTSRFEVMISTYGHNVTIEAKLMIEMFRTQVFPAAVRYQKELARSMALAQEVLGSEAAFTEQRQLLVDVNHSIEEASVAARKLEMTYQQGATHKIREAGEELRHLVDGLEGLVDDQLWPWPKYRELLFHI